MEAEILPSQSLGDGIGLPGLCVSKGCLSSGSLRKLLLGLEEKYKRLKSIEEGTCVK